MILRGANLGEVDVMYKKLSEWDYYEDQRKDLIKKIENLYFYFSDECNKIKVHSFPQKEGKVKIKEGMIFHRCSREIESLSNIAKYGIIASEWFGQEESEGEGAFCAFLNRIHDRNITKGEALNNRTLKTQEEFINLFFDDDNIIMKNILSWDYFKYKKIKNTEPEKLDFLYSKEKREIFDKVIEPDSPGSNCIASLSESNILPYSDWSAIPGGIPAKLVNGICIKNMKYNKKYIEELSKLFPNATIFNSELDVICNINKNTQDLGMETVEIQKQTLFMDQVEKNMENEKDIIGEKNEKY